MRAAGVAVFHIFSDCLSCVIEAAELSFVEEFVPHLAVEALDIAVLYGLAGGSLISLLTNQRATDDQMRFIAETMVRKHLLPYFRR